MGALKALSWKIQKPQRDEAGTISIAKLKRQENRYKKTNILCKERNRG